MSVNAKPVVQTAGLTKIFRDFWHRQKVVAVDRLDMEIQPNEVFGLLGPNGSGKSTTIKMLLGLLYPTRGRISVLGYAPTDVAIKSRIGYLPEESYLYRFLNARETLDYYARLFQIPRPERQRRVEQLLEMVGLTREARRQVGEYSKGMQRRIGLAQALINDPDLLILDEPTTGLDPLGTREIKDLILFLNREKRKTILLCSHLLGDVEDVCQRVVILYGGRRQAMGDIHELLSREYMTQITTERLSDATIERIKRLVEQDEGKHVVNVAAPSDKLETFFLRIVREAQAARQQTSGADGSGRIADFLAGPDQGQELVESLVAASQAPKEEAHVEDASAAEPQPAAAVLDDLVTASRSRSAATPAAAHETPPREQQVDRDLIDNLIHRSDDGKE
jgi:ABC-2 type transport system ATP-binding protein